MADAKITDLPAVVTHDDTDLIEVVQNVSTTPENKKTTWSSIKTFLKTYFDTLYQAGGTYLTPANIEDSIVDGHTTVAPSGNAVFDALAGKQATMSKATQAEVATGTDDTKYTTPLAVAKKITNPMTTQGDVIYGGSSGLPTRLAKGNAGQVLKMNSGATAPEWGDDSGGLPISFAQTNLSIDRAFTYTDDINVMVVMNATNYNFGVISPAKGIEWRDVRSDWQDPAIPRSAIKLGSYVYVLLRDSSATPDAFRLYRYDYTNLSAGGTLMSFSGSKVLTSSDTATNYIRIACDGTYIYISFEAGNSANGYVLAKYSISGTTLTYVSSITVGTSNSMNNGYFCVSNTGKIFTTETTTPNYGYAKYTSAGSLSVQAGSNYHDNYRSLINIQGKIYAYEGRTDASDEPTNFIQIPLQD